MPIVPINSLVRQVQELETIPIRPGQDPTVYLRDVATVAGRHRHPHRLRPGQRPPRRLHPRDQAGRRLDALGRQQRQGRPARACRRSCPTTSRSASSSTSRPPSPAPCGAWSPKALLGAVLTGLMVLLFLRDWRSVIVVVLNIPFALLRRAGGPVADRADDQPDDAGRPGAGRSASWSTRRPSRSRTSTTRWSARRSIARAVRRGNQETAVPRLLAMLCVLAVFIPSFFMQGAAQALFVPLSLAVGFAMVTSYLLSSTFVPVAVGLAAAPPSPSPG